MNKYVKKALCVLLTGTFAFSLASCSGDKVSEGDIKSLFKDTSKISFSYDYTELKDSKKIKLNLGGRVWYPETDFKGLSQAAVRTAIHLFFKICIL